MSTLWDSVREQLNRVSADIEVPQDVVEAQTARQVEVQSVESSEARKRWEDTAVKALRLAAQGGYPGYARTHLKIFDKAGDKRPLELNAAQLYLEAMANEQLQTQGFVRLIVAKGRQMGISTYIGGRGYYKTTRRMGQKAFILAHELNASGKLFETVKNFHEAIDPRYRPHTQRSNQKELIFDRLKGGYTVGTAKQGETGRSFTVQFFHGSEVAFWPSADQIALGLLQTIGTVPGTEIWMESTGNGMNGYFYSAAMQARKQLGDFRLAFLPWFWDQNYSRSFITEARKEEFMGRMTVDDQQYMKAHSLTLEQMNWRAAKIDEFAMAAHGNMEVAKVKFAQEYPATLEEAFSGSQEESFIGAMPVLLARRAYAEAVRENGGKRPTASIYGTKRMGIDPSWLGADSFRIWMRQGRIAWRAGAWQKQKLTESYGRILRILEVEQPDEIYIDCVGIGAGLYDMLSDNDTWGSRVFGIMAGDSADDPERHFNKKAEMWWDLRQWLTENPQVMLEDIDDIQSDLTSVRPKREQRQRTKLESKDEMRGRGVPSPDDGDALALTFAYPSSGHTAPGQNRSTLDPRRPVVYGGGLR